MKRFLVVGESILDVINGRAAPGGSPANVAVGLGRLGHDVGLWTHLGTDTAGLLLHDHLTEAGVVLLAPFAGVTSKAVARIQPDGSAHYDFAVDWPRWPGGVAAPAAHHLHTGSLAALLAPGAGDVGRLVDERRPTTTVSFDPNIRPALVGPADGYRARVERIVAASDVVKASDEDLTWLYAGADVADVARRWLASGPAVVVVTLGAEGALAVTATGHAALTVARSGAEPPTRAELAASKG